MLRDELAKIALQWQERFGVAPSITSAISEYDAAKLVGMSEYEYSEYMKDKTAVSKGADLVFQNIRYQVKANRKSGKNGSFGTVIKKRVPFSQERSSTILQVLFHVASGISLHRVV